MRQIDLRFHLCAIASINENARPIRQNRTKPRRSSEPRQPRQSRVTRGNIFALMRVSTGHQKSVQPLTRYFLA